MGGWIYCSPRTAAVMHLEPPRVPRRLPPPFQRMDSWVNDPGSSKKFASER